MAPDIVRWPRAVLRGLSGGGIMGQGLHMGRIREPNPECLVHLPRETNHSEDESKILGFPGERSCHEKPWW